MQYVGKKEEKCLLKNTFERKAGQVFDFPLGKVLTEVAITRSKRLHATKLPIFLPLVACCLTFVAAGI